MPRARPSPVAGGPDASLVLTNDWRLYNGTLAALNCLRLPDCAVVFAPAPSPADEARILAEFPFRKLLRIDKDGGQVNTDPPTPLANGI